MKGLKGKNVLVTGATSGIGQAIAAYFATEGANLALNYRNDPDKLDDTKELIDQMCDQVRGCGGKEVPVEGDMSEEADIIRMCNEAIDKLGSIDILVNNAGIQTAAPSHELETSDFDRVIQVNLRGAYLCAREVIKHLLNRNHGGVIINVSSVHEIIPRPEYISYSISNWTLDKQQNDSRIPIANVFSRISLIMSLIKPQLGS